MQSYTPSPSHVKPGPGKPAPGKIAPSSDAKRKQRRYRIGVAALLVLVLAIWYFRPNAQAAKVRQLQSDLFAASSQLTADQKKQKFEALRAESEKLSPADRKEVRKDMEKQFQTKMNSEAVQYLAMSPAERRKVIDAKIAKEQTMQQKRPANPPGGNAAAQSKELMEQMQKLQAGTNPPAAPTKPVASGQKEKVGQWEAEVFTWAGGAMSARYWVAKDFPNSAAILAALGKATNGGLSGMTKGIAPGVTDFPGMVVKTEMKMAGKTITSTVLSAEEKAVDAKEVEVPADYKETPVSFAPPPAK